MSADTSLLLEDRERNQQQKSQPDEETDSARIDRVMKRVLARPASVRERSILLGGLKRTRQQFADDSEGALALLAVGESEHDKSINPSELASWTNLCLAILNLDESLNRE